MNIGITMRLSSAVSYEESRDSLSRDMVSFIEHCNIYNFTILPNLSLLSAPNYFEINNIQAFILTGGDSIGEDLRRDHFEIQCLDYALKNNYPVIGICRGMQHLVTYFEGDLKSVSQHSNVTHNIFNPINHACTREVNSFHDMAVDFLPNCFKIDYISSDGVIEAISHKVLPWRGIMWHPERVQPFNVNDVNLFHSLFFT